jgi:hypothetical protein
MLLSACCTGPVGAKSRCKWQMLLFSYKDVLFSRLARPLFMGKVGIPEKLLTINPGVGE